MKIKIKKIDSYEAGGNTSDIVSKYSVLENNREFRITCRSNSYGRSFSLDGKDGTLYTSGEDNMVHLQKIALGGSCGLIIDDEPVEGLSPLAIRAVILAEHSERSKEIMITTEQTGDDGHYPLLLIDNVKKDIHQYSDIFTDLEGLK
jgi:hypothetical protein